MLTANFEKQKDAWVCQSLAKVWNKRNLAPI